jgi:hypothetical protein
MVEQGAALSRVDSRFNLLPPFAAQVEGMELMVDAFNGGELTALQDAEGVLGRLMGYEVGFGLYATSSCSKYNSGYMLGRMSMVLLAACDIAAAATAVRATTAGQHGTCYMVGRGLGCAPLIPVGSVAAMLNVH